MAAARPRITVVNDNAEFLGLMGEVLEAQRYPTTLIESDKPRALEAIVASHPELMVIDVPSRYGGLNGWNVLKGVRATAALGELPVLVCTADPTGVAAGDAELGAGSHYEALQMPFDVAHLTAAVDRMLGTAPPG